MAAIDAGAHALGFVLDPASLRHIVKEDITEIVSRIPPFIQTVAVFGHQTVDTSLWHVCQVIQAESLTPQPPHPWIKTVRLQESTQIDSTGANAILIDAYDPVKAGGTGQTVDRALAAEVLVPCPLILAGGLTPENVGEAIHQVRPWAVDVSSGVEASPGVKDQQKLIAFCAAVRTADNSPSDQSDSSDPSGS